MLTSTKVEKPKTLTIAVRLEDGETVRQRIVRMTLQAGAESMLFRGADATVAEWLQALGAVSP